ncbi:polysaccharide deacetylase family protein [Herbiconiux moechotypicola]|uniref:Polysaccharide deacetylase family protein n=1 Tax=Herbiconiux moechotypicola TaxID=637393 RepID=A0ABP5QJE3_9MICO|nr:polysaccharide deacetylase family protein [Herbiconiux moechotypicola]MCS5730087.1 polysaccharide deacetylase family protein [Herbiconiux moechotypicola]
MSGTGRRAPAPFAFAPDAPPLQPFGGDGGDGGGARVLVQFVLNLEHWTLDRPMPRAILPAPHGLSVVPDVANHSWVLYGLRAGLPRVAAALAPIGASVTVALNSDVVEHYPQVADLIAERGWEVVGHGIRQQSIQGFDDERAVVEEAIEVITRRFGAAPRGWLGPGMNQTDETLRILRETGLEFDHDWMIDDRPVWLDAGAGRSILGLPYTVELNDVTTYQVQTQPAGSLLARTAATLPVLTREAELSPVVMPIGLHPHIMGVPHRIAELEAMVDLVQGAAGCAAVTSSQVHDWFAAQVPAPAVTAPAVTAPAVTAPAVAPRQGAE